MRNLLRFMQLIIKH